MGPILTSSVADRMIRNSPHSTSARRVLDPQERAGGRLDLASGVGGQPRRTCADSVGELPQRESGDRDRVANAAPDHGILALSRFQEERLHANSERGCGELCRFQEILSHWAEWVGQRGLHNPAQVDEATALDGGEHSFDTPGLDRVVCRGLDVAELQAHE